MVLLEFSMSPTGQAGSLAPYVARCTAIVEASGLPHQLHAMGTLIEGEWDEVMAVVKRCYDALRDDCPRIACSIKIDAREGRSGAIRTKVASVERELGRERETPGA